MCRSGLVAESQARDMAGDDRLRQIGVGCDSYNLTITRCGARVPVELYV